jgi:hypothetical protein
VKRGAHSWRIGALALPLVAAGEPEGAAPGSQPKAPAERRLESSVPSFPFPNHPRFNRRRPHPVDWSKLTRGDQPGDSNAPRREDQGFARGDAFAIERSRCEAPRLLRAELEREAEAILDALPRCPDPAPHVRRITCVPAGSGAARLADGSELALPEATTWLVEVEGLLVPPTLPFPGLFHTAAESFSAGWYLIDDATGALGDYGFSGAPSLYDGRL